MPRVLIGTESGLYLPDGVPVLPGPTITSLGAHPEDPRSRFASAYGGAFASEDGGRTWRAIGLDGLDLWTIAVRARRGATELWAGVEPAGLYRRTWPDGSWERVESLDRAPGAEEWHSPWGPADLSSVSFDGDDIWVGIEVGGVYVSRDDGASWTPANRGIYEDVHTVAATSAARYAATGAGFYRSRGEGWQQADDGIDRSYVMPIAIDASDPSHLWTAGASGPPPAWGSNARARVYESRDGARSWSALPDLPRDVRGAVQRKGLALVDGRPVAGTSDGFVLALDDGSWRTLASGLPEIHALLAA